MSIEELLRQMEDYRSRREERDHRPEWLKNFIQEVAAVFEPLTTVGRVGYECRVDEQGWTVCMYLGTSEIIGGPNDGRIDHAGFRIDIRQLSEVMTDVHRFEWYSIAEDAGQQGSTLDSERTHRSLVSMHGLIEGDNHMKLEILAAPPRHVRPGLQYTSGGRMKIT